MFRWYQNAEVCYGYLSDVSDVSELAGSRWFTQGWTLQELLAPEKLVFFSQQWKPIGTKDSLKKRIEEITGIDRSALDQEPLSTFSISQRMLWASDRETTRVEDTAYCLMGIFDVNMPLVYGEGSKSFLRLQEEIMKTSDDQSIFAWKDKNLRNEEYFGLLARSPVAFKESKGISSLGVLGIRDSVSTTSKGLRAHLFLMPMRGLEGDYYACLECQVDRCITKSPATCLQIVSRNVKDSVNNILESQYARVYPARMVVVETTNQRLGQYSTVFVRQNQSVYSRQVQNMTMSTLFWIRNFSGHEVTARPLGSYDVRSEIFTSPQISGKMGALILNENVLDDRPIHLKVFPYVIIFGLDELRKPWCFGRTPGIYLHSISPSVMFEEYEPTGEELMHCAVGGPETGLIEVTLDTEWLYTKPVYTLTLRS